MKIGISLSGGGVRAAVFHFGLLARLAETNRWEEIEHISTVSGGSLGIALIIGNSDGTWPDAEAFLLRSLPKAKLMLTESSLVWACLRSGVLRPHHLFRGRAHLIGSTIAKQWGVTQKVRELPHRPRWTINCTTYETGKNWRFSWKRMGDYLTGYVLDPDFPLSDAVAASAGFPGGIGPLKVKTSEFSWVRFKGGSRIETEAMVPLHKHFHLWDGGVYENLGSEALVKPGSGLRDDLDFYIASDAGRPFKFETRRFSLAWPFYRPPLRLLDCAMDQVRALRARTINSQFRSTSEPCGAYLQMGCDRDAIFRLAGKPAKALDTQQLQSSREDAKRAATFPTTLRRLSEEEYDTIFRHGYEVADATLDAYVPGKFARAE